MFSHTSKETYLNDEINRYGDMATRKRTRTTYHLICDNCGSPFTRLRGAMDKKRLCVDYKHFCKTCDSPSLYSKFGKKTYIQNLEKRIGEKLIDSCGYVRVYVGPKDSDKCLHKGYGHYCGSVREHILVMAEHLGRPLERGEVVHHIDGNKTNNDIQNLQLMTVTEHNACHASNDALVMDLYRKGVVKYNRDTQRYYLAN